MTVIGQIPCSTHASSVVRIAATPSFLIIIIRDLVTMRYLSHYMEIGLPFFIDELNSKHGA